MTLMSVSNSSARNVELELITGGALIGRFDYNRRNAFNRLIVRFIIEAFYVGIPFYVLYFNKTLGSIFNLYYFSIYIVVYTTLWIVLETLYDGFYALNDCVFAKYEENPSIRGYCRTISLKRLLLFRLIYIYVLSILLIRFFHIKLENLVIAVVLITYALFLHNLVRVNLWRRFTIFVIRVSRLTFIPIAMGGADVIPLLIIVLMPYLLLQINYDYKYYLTKYNVLIPPNRPPLYLIFSSFIPFSALFLYPNNLLALLPNCIIIFGSIYRRVIRTNIKK